MLNRQAVIYSLICVIGLTGAVEAASTGYFYAYFKGGWPTGGSSGVFLSYSSDGLNFSSLNDGNPILVPPQPPDFPDGENQMRDPSVVYGPDGLFHMVWTSGITTKTIGYASSPNLKDWSTPQRIQVWDNSVNVTNTWAPEIFYDDDSEKYQIVWASNLDGGDHKLYSFATEDFTTFSTPQVFYYNGNTVIDGMVAEDKANNRFLMALKDERGGAKNISIATSNSAQGPWTTNNAVVVGPGSGIENNAVEGPSLIKIGDTWHLYYDAYGAGYLGVATSTDLVTWVNRTSQSVQPAGPNAHHGTVFAAPLEKIGFELPIFRSDLNGDGEISLADWTIFIDHHLSDLSGLSATEQAARGDLNGDGANNYLDYRMFRSDYEAFQGMGTFETLLDEITVPEPATGVLLVLGVSSGLGWRHKAVPASSDTTPRSPAEADLRENLHRQLHKRPNGFLRPFPFLER